MNGGGGGVKKRVRGWSPLLYVWGCVPGRRGRRGGGGVAVCSLLSRRERGKGVKRKDGFADRAPLLSQSPYPHFRIPLCSALTPRVSLLNRERTASMRMTRGRVAGFAGSRVAEEKMKNKDLPEKKRNGGTRVYTPFSSPPSPPFLTGVPRGWRRPRAPRPHRPPTHTSTARSQPSFSFRGRRARASVRLSPPPPSLLSRSARARAAACLFSANPFSARTHALSMASTPQKLALEPLPAEAGACATARVTPPPPPPPPAFLSKTALVAAAGEASSAGPAATPPLPLTFDEGLVEAKDATVVAEGGR